VTFTIVLLVLGGSELRKMPKNECEEYLRNRLSVFVEPRLVLAGDPGGVRYASEGSTLLP
jgi:hypothetical protein